MATASKPPQYDIRIVPGTKGNKKLRSILGMVEVDDGQSLLVSEGAENLGKFVRKINLGRGIVKSLAGKHKQRNKNGPFKSCKFIFLFDLTLDKSTGLVYAACGSSKVGIVRVINRKERTVTSLFNKEQNGFHGGMFMAQNRDTLYCVNPYANAIYTVDTKSGDTKLFAGVPETEGFEDESRGFEDGECKTAKFYLPHGVCLDTAGENLFVADRGNNAIRKINLTTNIVSTIIGIDFKASKEQGKLVPESEPSLPSPERVVYDRGNLIISLPYHRGARYWDSKTGLVSKIEGLDPEVHIFCCNMYGVLYGAGLRLVYGGIVMAIPQNAVPDLTRLLEPSLSCLPLPLIRLVATYVIG